MAKRKRLAERVKECVKERIEILAEIVAGLAGGWRARVRGGVLRHRRAAARLAYLLDCLRVDVARLAERLGEANQEREAALRERDAADAYAKECEARTATLRQALLRLLGGGSALASGDDVLRSNHHHAQIARLKREISVLTESGQPLGRLERELLSRHECELAAHRAVLASKAPQ